MVLRLLTIGLCILLSSLPATRASDDDDGDAVMVDSATADFRGYDRDYMADWRSDWAGLTGRMNNPKCIDIPANLTLCRDIGYSQMRLPNLLDHDTIREVSQQAKSWVPLTNIQCHPDTKLFLCSLFSPICLDRPIPPCQTLCEAVRAGCESRMLKYGYPWPEMLRCDKFPPDNDLCISIRAQAKPVTDLFITLSTASDILQAPCGRTLNDNDDNIRLFGSLAPAEMQFPSFPLPSSPPQRVKRVPGIGTATNDDDQALRPPPLLAPIALYGRLSVRSWRTQKALHDLISSDHIDFLDHLSISGHSNRLPLSQSQGRSHRPNSGFRVIPSARPTVFNGSRQVPSQTSRNQSPRHGYASVLLSPCRLIKSATVCAKPGPYSENEEIEQLLHRVRMCVKIKHNEDIRQWLHGACDDR
ncbi:hypothetical protein LSAT2_029114 [Lamellibrachia satsuma]|nr:hypothetical protein LSAT2_029114 [Lamellibrachia satsuma]